MFMSTLKVTNKSTGDIVSVKIDQEDLEKFKNYTYYIDNNNDKPFREEKINNLVRRIFLARDIKNMKYGDGRTVGYKNGDYHDLRSENLIEGKTKMSKFKTDTGNFWPHTLNSFLNFLEKRNGIDEDLVYLFLTKTKDAKYSRKRIDMVFKPDDYVEYQNKQVQSALHRILQKYFGEWGGKITAVKDVTTAYKGTMVNQNQYVATHIPIEKNMDKVKTTDNPEPKILTDELLMKIPLETLIAVIQKRMNMTIHFSGR